ncbi:serine/threonine-protein kinase [Streptomyces ipomoeae]|uniref:serine/threonine-protein kinase n=1 Tax=Streptomyces ipomoeae TaxID=103232 RepID=UPI001FD087E2|nr:serine/threonine-protein kinase [Streptomyces ipomoeae]MDX2935216.1 serine/threonine-protein kinase [Streptomyces ipomoeae]
MAVEREQERERVVAGRYLLGKRLGAGGGGSVWLAEDRELLAQVALKEIDVPELPDEASGDDRATRGRKEALKAAQLREHPNVVTVYDVVRHDGRPWIVMEYLPGTRDLRAVVLERGPLPSGEVARIGAAALDGLSAGHRLGIIHRDVKPSNILLAPDHYGAVDRRVLLTDYGISLRPRETRLTRSGMLVGTPGFVAPERVSGGEASAATDLFSLGVTLYFAVEGVAPFERDTLDGTLMAVLRTEPLAPSRASDRLARVIMGLLAKEPEERLGAAEAAGLLAEAAEEAQATQAPGKAPAADKSPAATETKETAAADVAQGGHGPVGSGGSRRTPPRRTPPRRTLVLLALSAVLMASGGLATGAALAGGGEERPAPGVEAKKAPAVSASPAPSPTVTRGTYPYGGPVGLREELMPGQCVDAEWKDGEFKGRPRLKIVDCHEDDPEGQVITTVEATGPAGGAAAGATAAPTSAALTSAADAVRGECTRRTAELRGTMADPVLYVLTPEPGQSEPPASACLLFLRNATLGGPLGAFRKHGEEVYVTQLGPGDCVDAVEDEDDEYTITLVSCDEPHTDQFVGWTWASGEESVDGVDMTGLCERKYGVNWARGKGHEMSGWYSGDDEWDAGFRHVLCGVVREDGGRLPGGVVKPAY